VVEVGPFFAVHLDADESFVQHRGRGVVLEALVLHDVAPVARRVADAEKDGFVLRFRRGESLGTPRIPVHRISGVLAQVKARFRNEAVHEGDCTYFWFPTSGREPTNTNLWFGEQ